MKYLSVSIGLIAATLMTGSCNGSETAQSGAPEASGTSSGTGTAGSGASGSGITGSGTTSSGKSRKTKKSKRGDPQMGDDCNADAAQWALGQVLTDELMERARKDSGAKVVRPLLPGLAITMEYQFDRLNLEVNEARIVIGVRCG